MAIKRHVRGLVIFIGENSFVVPAIIRHGKIVSLEHCVVRVAQTVYPAIYPVLIADVEHGLYVFVWNGARAAFTVASANGDA